MQFLIGIDLMSREEKIALLAQLKAITGFNLIKQGSSEFVLKAKNGLFWAGKKLADLTGQVEAVEKLEKWNSQSNWNPNLLQKEMACQQKELELLSDRGVEVRLRQELARLAGVAPEADLETIAQHLVKRLAELYQLDEWHFQNDTALEEKVYSACLEEQINILKQKLNSLDREEEIQMQEALEQQINQLSRAEQEAIKQAMGLDELSAASMMTLLKTTSGVALAQVILSGTGFGVYLFLTTMIKALSLMLGVTFSFGTYTAATTAMAFLLSFPFLLLVVALSGGFIWHKTSVKIDEQLTKIVFLAGRAKVAYIETAG
ncbi:MAG: hypothetical protein ACOX5W_00660 [Bacillota bacterium]